MPENICVREAELIPGNCNTNIANNEVSCTSATYRCPTGATLSYVSTIQSLGGSASASGGGSTRASGAGDSSASVSGSTKYYCITR
jgi:hypothetical protein